MVGEWSCDMWGNHATCSCCRPFWGGEVFLWTSKHDLLYTMKNYHWRCNCSARVGDTLSHYPWVLLFFSFSSWIVARMELWQTFLHFAGTNQRIARLGQEASKPEVEGKCCVFYTREYKNWKIMFPPKIVYTPRQSWPARLDALLPCILCYRQLFWPWFFLGNSTVSFRGWKCATCVVGAKAAVHHFAWLDATGRLFGLCEVLLSYIDGRELVLTLQFSKLAGGL